MYAMAKRSGAIKDKSTGKRIWDHITGKKDEEGLKKGEQYNY